MHFSEEQLKAMERLREEIMASSGPRIDFDNPFTDKTPEEIEEMLEGDGILTAGSIMAPKEVWRDVWEIAKQKET